MKDTDAIELIRGARSNLHTLSGLLTGVSASLYCSKLAEGQQSAESHINEAQQLTKEAEIEISQIREALIKLSNLFE